MLICDLIDTRQACEYDFYPCLVGAKLSYLRSEAAWTGWEEEELGDSADWVCVSVVSCNPSQAFWECVTDMEQAEM